MKRLRYSMYRDSAVDWLGEVPAHWDVRPLKTAIIRNDGGVWGDDADEPNAGTPVIRSTEQTVDGGWAIAEPAFRLLSASERAKATLRVGDLVVTKSSGSELHIGKTSLVDAHVASLDACFSNFMQRLRFGPFYEPRLAWYLLNSPAGRQQLVFRSNTTTGLANLSGTIIGEVVASFPPIEEQRAIAAFLDRETAKVDTLVAKKRLLVDRLEEQRSALISRIVTSGLPPEAARAAGLDPSPHLKQSRVEWIGDVPEHWEVKRLQHAVIMRAGNGITSEDIDDSGPFAVYGGNGTRGFTNSYTHDGDHVLIGRQGALCGNVTIARGRFWASEHAVVTTPRSAASVDWLAYLLEALNLNQYSAAAAQPGLAVERIKLVHIPVPPLSEQRAMVSFLATELAQRGTLQSQVKLAIRRLKEYRTALITAAVTGKIDVRESAAGRRT